MSFQNQNHLPCDCLYSVCTSQRTHCARITKTYKLALFGLTWLFIAETTYKAVINACTMDTTEILVLNLATEIDRIGLQKFEDLKRKYPVFFFTGQYCVWKIADNF